MQKTLTPAVDIKQERSNIQDLKHTHESAKTVP